jgi:hypothetical protein
MGKPYAYLLRLSLLGLILALSLLSCAPDEDATIREAQYAAKIVGDWQGIVGDVRETISFSADGKFTSHVRGTWAIEGNVITLSIDSADMANVLNKTATSTIEMFKQNELTVRSSRGETSTFVRM